MKYGILHDSDGSWYICNFEWKIIQTNYQHWILGYDLGGPDQKLYIEHRIKWYESIEELVAEEFASIV